ncbi:MAG: 4Fe-4S binding protein, partial [Bifidobacteriaceae bacterium]|nr:4Fe-4S binding protein [Bifidobacteriaceae bacterium]
ASKTYAKKSAEIVQKNHKAIEIVANSEEILHTVAVPDSWKTAADTGLKNYEYSGSESTKNYVKNILNPLSHQQGNSLSVKTLIDNGMLDGTMPTGTAACEKRSVADFVPHFDPTNCIGCNECSFVCPHAAIRPILVTDKELEQAPEGFYVRDLKGSDGLHYRIQVSIEDCTGCGLCIQACPVNKNLAGDGNPVDIKGKSTDSQPLKAAAYSDETNEIENWRFAMNVPEKTNPDARITVKSSQYNKPLVEFSGACAGCGETPYVKLLTQLFGCRMTIANATGCSSIWGGAIPAAPYTTNACGFGPTWSNSLLEDNAEFGLGMFLANKNKRNKALEIAKSLITSGEISDDLLGTISEWIDGFSESEGSRERAEKLKTALEGSPYLQDFANYKDLFAKPSQWIIGGDGWGYDIGYGGIDHVLAGGEDVNILVLDNEVYSNTGGQVSKATNEAAIAKFAAAGKRSGKKDLGAMAMIYGNVYVAQIASGANPAQTLKAFKEAESFNGPSIIIAYTPCINHGLKAGMHMTLTEAKDAVESGYWSLYRFDPRRLSDGKSPMQLDFKKPDFSKLCEFLLGQNRYSALASLAPNEADELYKKTESDAKIRFSRYLEMSTNS